MSRSPLPALLFLALSLAPTLAEARVTRLVVLDVLSPTFEGLSFGSRGQYERLSGIAYGELDPSDPLNAGIVDLALAPRNPSGRVEYSVDFYLLKPVDLSLGSGGLLFEVLNGGQKGAHAVLDNGTGDNDPHLARDAGNGYLMNHGHVIVWSAWQGDVIPGDGRMLARFPIATDNGGSIVGRSREEYSDVPGTGSFTADLSYPSADRDPSLATLTIRQNEPDPRQTPPGLTWQYLNDRQIQINRPGGFDSGAIYEFIYPAKDPIVMGVGFAAIRDVVSFLRHEIADDDGVPNPLAPAGVPSIQYTQAIGFSQSGKLLRDLIYEGFNQDEAGRQVLDGIHPVIAGGRRTFTNYRFAQPGRGQRQHADHSFPGGQFPFSYATLTDPISGRTDGLLLRCATSGTCPLIIQTDSDSELWQGRGSLTVTDPLGNDVTLPDNVRMYLFAGAQHGPSNSPARGICQQLDNPLEWTYHVRALTSALSDWIVNGVPPPDSRYPSRGAGTLVPSDQSSTGWPAIPGVTYNGLVDTLRLLDFSVQPPREGNAYTVLVPRVDADGNTAAGIRPAFLAVPDATYTGWNLRAPGHAPAELCELNGSYIPFFHTRGERLAAQDPRPSLEERYPDHQAYVDQVTATVDRLITDRLVLPEDRAELIFLADEKSVP